MIRARNSPRHAPRSALLRLLAIAALVLIASPDARAAAADFHFLVGEELVSFYESTPGTHRGFCKVCGAPVLVKFDERSRSAQTDPGAVALYGVALATLGSVATEANPKLTI